MVATVRAIAAARAKSSRCQYPQGVDNPVDIVWWRSGPSVGNVTLSTAANGARVSPVDGCVQVRGNQTRPELGRYGVIPSPQALCTSIGFIYAFLKKEQT